MDLSIFIERMEAAGHAVTCVGEGRYATVLVDGKPYGHVINDVVHTEVMT